MENALSLEQAARAVVLCFDADVPVALWGPPGIGKSSVIAQIAEKLGYKLYDFRLSDKEPSDLGGIPFPVEGRVSYLVPDGLPFDSDEKAIVLLDEFDRADLSVQNVALQIILDRRVNGHKLSENARVVLAGNGTTDVGTATLSKAAANRVVHLYIETGSQAALDSYLKWADDHAVSPLLRGFAQFRQEVWANGGADPQMEELAYPTPRSFDYADRILRAADEVNFRTSDILPAVIGGCVGRAAATEFLGYRDVFSQAPSINDIIADPDHVDVPRDPGILYALSIALTDYAVRDDNAATAVAQYGLRWPEEPAAFFFRRLLEKTKGRIAATKPYLKWQNARLRDDRVSDDTIDRSFTYKVLSVYPDAKPLPDNDDWVNRVQVTSERSGQPYTMSQRRSNMERACSCPGWRTHRKCDHLAKIPQ